MPIRRGETLFELLMGTVGPIVGCLIAFIALREFTDSPLWICVAIALPMGTIAAWLVILGSMYFIYFAIVRPMERHKEQAKKRIRDEFNRQ